MTGNCPYGYHLTVFGNFNSENDIAADAHVWFLQNRLNLLFKVLGCFVRRYLTLIRSEGEREEEKHYNQQHAFTRFHLIVIIALLRLHPFPVQFLLTPCPPSAM